MLVLQLSISFHTQILLNFMRSSGKTCYFLPSYLVSCCFRCFKSLCYLLMFLTWGNNNLLHKPFSVFQLKWSSFCGSCDTLSLCPESESENEVAQSCPTLCDPMACSLPGFSVHGIFQARILEWVTISFSRRSSRPRD